MQAFPIPPVIQQFASRFRKAGFSLYIVGGAVRDHLLGLKMEDYDFTTDALPNEVMELFTHVIPTGIDHGTITVHFAKQQFEVTTFRSEGEYRDGRHPSSVQFIRSLEEDLKRRDFTINAFAVDCNNSAIIDLHGGMDDLHHKIIRAIGNPEQRFEEDALRILRAARIASKLDFTIEEQTKLAMSKQRENLAKVSNERIRDELFKLLLSDHPQKGLSYLRDCRILSVILPELARAEGVLQGGMHSYDVLEHSLRTCQAAVGLTGSLEVRLAALLHDIGKCDVIQLGEERNTFYNHEIVGARLAMTILKRLKASNEQIETVSHLVRHHMFDYQPSWTDSAVRRFIQRVGVQYLDMLFTLRLADQLAIHDRTYIDGLEELKSRIETILAAKDALSVKDLAVNGNDLISLGIPKGERIGKTLQFLLETVLDDPKQNNRPQLLLLAQHYQQFSGFNI